MAIEESNLKVSNHLVIPGPSRINVDCLGAPLPPTVFGRGKVVIVHCRAMMCMLVAVRPSAVALTTVWSEIRTVVVEVAVAKEQRTKNIMLPVITSIGIAYPLWLVLSPSGLRPVLCKIIC
eukprot:jgi/Bigna1/78156/fgenesh1_pg.52_\